MKRPVITIILVAVAFVKEVNSFSYPNYKERRPITLHAAGGMGMAVTSSKKKGKKKNGGSKSKGMGKTRSSSDGKKYDVAKSMIKNEKYYDELMTESVRSLQNEDEWVNDNDIEITTQYIIAARCAPGSITSKDSKTNSALAAASDWIPAAQICIVRPIHLHEEEDESDEPYNSSVRAAVSFYCREISYAATLAAPTLKSLPRSSMQYSAEPLDSFVKNVYEDVIEGKAADTFVDPNGSSDSKEISMTKSKAREIIQLEEGCKDASLIKKAYKQQSMLHHPDRFVNSDKTKEEIDASTRQFGLVKMAYEALQSGVRDEVNSNGMVQSWYESLGSKSRSSEFSGAIDLISNEKAGLLCNKAFKAAIVAIDPDLTNTFVVSKRRVFVFSFYCAMHTNHSSYRFVINKLLD